MSDRPEAPAWWRSQADKRQQHDDETLTAALREAFDSCTKGPEQVPTQADVERIGAIADQIDEACFPQDATAVSSVLGDTCPRCGGQLDYDEVDIGVGTLRGNPGCPDCHWVPGHSETPVSCPRCGTPGDQDDCRECHPTRPR